MIEDSRFSAWQVQGQIGATDMGRDLPSSSLQHLESGTDFTLVEADWRGCN
jgi:hypothetical protein